MTFGLLSSVLQVGVWTASPRVHEMKSRGLSSDPVVSSIPVDDNIPASYLCSVELVSLLPKGIYSPQLGRGHLVATTNHDAQPLCKPQVLADH